MRAEGQPATGAADRCPGRSAEALPGSTSKKVILDGDRRSDGRYLEISASSVRRTKPLRGGKDPGLVHKPSASATRSIDSDFAPCLYQRAAPCYSSAWLRLAAASVRFSTSRSPSTLPRTRPLPIYSIKAKAVPVAASSSEIASARPTGPELRPRSFTALRIQHSSEHLSWLKVRGQNMRPKHALSTGWLPPSTGRYNPG